MFCPKCKAKIGLHSYESRTQHHLAQGLACCVCGYWAESSGTVSKSKRSKHAKKRKR